MKLSITIVNYNQKYFPRLCIEALKESKVDFKYEVIVCDNASEDDSIEYLRAAEKAGDIKLVEAGRNLGYGSGHNLAAKKARGEYVLILNTDITVEPETLQGLVDYLNEAEDVGMVGPKLIYHNGEVQQSCRRNFRFFDLVIKRSFLRKIGPFKKRYEHYLMEDFDKDCVQEVDLITGAFMMMPRKIFEEVGGFDERYFLFMEDFDLCRKVWAAGYKVVYNPEFSAVHYHKRLSDGAVWQLPFKRSFWLHLSSAMKYFWKWK